MGVSTDFFGSRVNVNWSILWVLRGLMTFLLSLPLAGRAITLRNQSWIMLIK